ncbi:MAG: glycosyltransferase family 4 protein [Methanomicrobiales archaeon]|nr:glycosyltransferase family 4 protein [Methanomicrobiales archaeon]
MKIAYIYDAIYPWVKGGVEKRVYELSKCLIQRGHEVTWYGVKWWNGSDIINMEGIRLIGIGEPQHLYANGRRTVSEPLTFALNLFLAIKESYDIIDCQQFPYFPCFSAKVHSDMKKLPLVLTWHEYWGNYWKEYLGKAGFIGAWIESLAIKLTENHIAVSQSTKRRLQPYIQNDIKVIPNGIWFENIQAVPQSSYHPDILFAGRLIREKHVDFLIQAIDIIRLSNPEIKCLIIGSGPEYLSLTSLIKQLNLTHNIEIKPFLDDHNELLSLMKSSKLFVLPSTREGFSIVALEAMACGVPIVTITHEMNAVCDLVTSSSGICCDLSKEDIGNAILNMLHSGIEKKKESIDIARNFDWSIISRSTESYYSNLLP